MKERHYYGQQTLLLAFLLFAGCSLALTLLS